MIKKNRAVLIITSIIVLIPMLAGVILWDRLPDVIATHFSVGNEADGWSSKGLTVFGIPLIMLGVQWLCVFATLTDPKKQNISPMMFRLVLWIIPAISVVVMTVIYAMALEAAVNMGMAYVIMIGVLIIILGNYMPKCRQSYTMGYKLPWTLSDEGNWNATHRFAGWIMTIGGVILLVTSPFGILWISLPVMIVTAFAPVVYSFIYYLRHK